MFKIVKLITDLFKTKSHRFCVNLDIDSDLNTLLNKIFTKKNDINAEKFYYLGSFTYQIIIYEKYLKQVGDENYKIEGKEFELDVRNDIVHAFYTIDTESKGYVMTVLDPVELFDSEYIMDIIAVPVDNDFL